jgi:indolepyruvate ferredoxin oxidoreductase alpha subunit
MDNFSRYPGVFAEWAPNEKVALDVGIGAAYAGSRALVAMKHVGANVAADSLFYAVYTGLGGGGLCIINADDPGMHSSQNEQDSRNYAKFAKFPMLEPSDSQEAKDFVGLALEISEKYDVPCVVRTVTRIGHSATPVEYSAEAAPPPPPAEKPAYQRNPSKFVMVPAFARLRHPVVEERVQKLAEYAETTPINKIEPGDNNIGIIASGSVYQYAREVFPDATFLKLGMVYPLPKKLIKEFASQVKQVVVIEELDPFFEEQIRLMGIEVRGKDIFPIIGEFNPSLIRKCCADAGLIPAVTARTELAAAVKAAAELAVRPPILCPGCGHRGMFYVFRESGALVLGDIGCYTLGAAPPLGAIHTTGCMGASIGVAHGIDKAGVKDRIIGVLGDSTFFHSGIHPLLDVLYNESTITVVVADNSITAMTGHQQHPGTGITLQNKTTKAVNTEQFVRSLGFEKVDVCDPYDIAGLTKVLEDHLSSGVPSVIIVKRPCVLYLKEKNPSPTVDPDTCVNCGVCLGLGCSPLMQGDDNVTIDPILCNGCGLCIQVCPAGAISK